MRPDPADDLSPAIARAAAVGSDGSIVRTTPFARITPRSVDQVSPRQLTTRVAVLLSSFASATLRA